MDSALNCQQIMLLGARGMSASVLKRASGQHTTASTTVSNIIAFLVTKNCISDCDQDFSIKYEFGGGIYFLAISFRDQGNLWQ